jgi:DNA invertase Pin-like site-specific DNA recombinase
MEDVMGDKTKVIGYMRVSTNQQVEGGLSLESQRQKLEAYAALYDLELVSVEIDAGVSAKSLNRPGLSSALASLEAGKAQALLIVKLDRLTRSVPDLGILIDDYFSPAKPFELMSVNDHIDTRTASGRMILNILATVSQWEREEIGERTTAALKAKYQRGEYCGGRLRYGFKNENGRIVKDERELEAVAMARRLRAEAYSLRVIAEKLEAAGYVNRKGNKFSSSVVRNMMECAA